MTNRIFRTFEYLFGRKAGIRHEMTAINLRGKTIYAPHSFEAHIALLEWRIKEFFKSFNLGKVYIPILYTPEGFPVFASPYLFAIALDTSASQNDGTTSFSYTVTGSNPILIAGVHGGGGTTSNSATYNSVGLTSRQEQLSHNSKFPQTMFADAGIATGAHTFAASAPSGYAGCWVASYSGANQTGVPDNTAQTIATTTSQVQSITTNANNCWVVYGIFYANGSGSSSFSAGTVTQRQSNEGQQLKMGDSNGAISPAGSTSATGTVTDATGNWGIQALSFAPAGAITGIGRSLLLTLLGVG